MKLQLLLVLLAAVIPFGVIARISITTSVHIYPVDIVISLIFVLVVFNIFKKKLYPYHEKSITALYLFIGFCFLSLIFNSNQLHFRELLVSFLYLLRFTMYSSLVFVFLLTSSRFSYAYKWILAGSGMLFVLAGFIQYFYYPNLRNLFYLGWDEHMHRMFATLLDPNFAGAFFTLVLLLIIHLLAEYSKKFFESKKRLKHYLTFSILLLSVIASFFAILLTYSRSSLIMLGITLITYFILIKKIKLLVFPFLVFLFAIFIIPKDFHVENMNPFRVASIEGRIQSMDRALSIFRDSPLYGVGFNAYRYAQKKYGFLDVRWEETHAGSGTSNTFLFVLATTGIVGFFLYMNFITAFFKTQFIKREAIIKGDIADTSNLYFNAMVTTSMIGVLTHGLFENTFFYPFVMIWVFCLLGLSVTKSQGV